MTPREIEDAVTRLAAQPKPDRAEARDVVGALLAALESGAVRAAEPSGTSWLVHAWVKQGILLAFRNAEPQTTVLPPFYFRDRDLLPTYDASSGGRNVRVVPGGSTVRRGSYLGDGVVIMPPAYVNVGAYVGPGSLIDSHVLVGSCAQIGARVHLSAAAQIGGVIEPVGGMPVVVEDDAFVGGGCGLYEGARVRRGAVLAPGVVITRAVPLVDLVRGTTVVADASGVLEVPERAVVVPGTRPAAGPYGSAKGIALYAPVIVKYRDAKTDAASALEQALR